MKKYGEAAIVEMLCKMYPEVARAIAEPLGKIDKITMYGEGNTAKLTEDVTKSFKQTIDGLSDSMGIDLNTVVSSFLGSKAAGDVTKKLSAAVENSEVPAIEVKPEKKDK
jgi:hypothetical protein